MTLQRVASVLRSHLEVWNLVSLALSVPFTPLLAKNTKNLKVEPELMASTLSKCSFELAPLLVTRACGPIGTSLATGISHRAQYRC